MNAGLEVADWDEGREKGRKSVVEIASEAGTSNASLILITSKFLAFRGHSLINIEIRCR